jgi:(2R)-3-sulfolactate dehydrogenase (NADP+)
VVDPGALAGNTVFYERIETLVAAMLADADVRLPGQRRQALSARARADGIEIPAALLDQLEVLARA